MLELGFFPLKQEEIGIIKRNVRKAGKVGPIQTYGTLISQYIQEMFGWSRWNRVNIGDVLYFTVEHSVQSGGAVLSKGKDGWQGLCELFN